MEVFFDEAGNTGPALLDKNQLAFVLASNNLTEQEALSLLAEVSSPQTQEVKFSKLKRTDAGIRKIESFFREALKNNERYKTTVFHKRFMVVTKIVDILVENVAYEMNFDLYRDGYNIALSNMTYAVAPVFCGEDRFDRFLSTFVEMIRNPISETIEPFYEAAAELINASSDPRFGDSLMPVLISRKILGDILGGNNSSSLDPAIPSLFNHCTAWGTQLQTEFSVVHDNSKQVAASVDSFRRFMDQSVEIKEIGYDRRKFFYPLRATGISLSDSKHHPQIQVADLFAGATLHMAKALASGNSDEVTEMLKSLGLEKCLVNVLWPSSDVTPQQLGTDDGSGVNPVDKMTEHLGRGVRRVLA